MSPSFSCARFRNGFAVHAPLMAIILVFLAFNACQSKQIQQRTLSDEKMARIMADLSIADAATNGLPSGYKKDSLMHVYIQQVYEIHGTTLEVYEQNLRMLSEDLPHLEMVVKQSEEMLTTPKK